LYTVYKNLLNPHLIKSAALEQTASQPLTPKSNANGVYYGFFQRPYGGCS
jgi:hypothetical protein